MEEVDGKCEKKITTVLNTNSRIIIMALVYFVTKK